jgi:hypothetical protein
VTIVEESAAEDTTFSVSLPAGTTQGVFNSSNSSHQDLPPQNQTDSVPFLNITNQGNVNLDIYLNMNVSLPTNIEMKADTDNNPSGATEINTTLQIIKSALTPDSSQGIWFWSYLSKPTPQTSERELNVSVSS